MKHCKGRHRGQLSDSSADKNFIWWGAVSDISLTVGKLISSTSTNLSMFVSGGMVSSASFAPLLSN